MTERIAALTAERDRLREACGYRWRKLLTETDAYDYAQAALKTEGGGE